MLLPMHESSHTFCSDDEREVMNERLIDVLIRYVEPALMQESRFPFTPPLASWPHPRTYEHGVRVNKDIFGRQLT
jgi:hypothetical protein